MCACAGTTRAMTPPCSPSPAAILTKTHAHIGVKLRLCPANMNPLPKYHPANTCVCTCEIMSKTYSGQNYQHLAYSLIGQDILNSYTSEYFSGITITSGFFQLYRSEGIITQSQLKYACATSLIATLICLSGSYLHMQLIFQQI